MVKKVLLFKTLLVDDLQFEAGTRIPAGVTFSLFTDYECFYDEPVTTVDESTILRHLLESSSRTLILNELGVTTAAQIHFEVRAPVVPPGGAPGDIDAIIAVGGRADAVIGIQCKRIKIEALNQEDDKVNKLSDVRGAVRQVNLQRENFGFHKNYLVLVIQSYGKLRNASNVAFRGPVPKIFKRIYEFPQRESLHEDVGVLFIAITQPTGKSYRRMYEIGVCLDKEARFLDQTAHLTNRIKELLSGDTG